MILHPLWYPLIVPMLSVLTLAMLLLIPVALYLGLPPGDMVDFSAAGVGGVLGMGIGPIQEFSQRRRETMLLL